MKGLTLILLCLMGIFALPLDKTCAAPMPLDISSGLNYDAVGTKKELDWISAKYTSGDRRLADIVGGHNLANSGRAFTTTDSLTSGTALPRYGVIGNYTPSFAYDNYNSATANYVSGTNALRIIATATGTGTVSASGTITLLAGQQLGFTNLNLLFVQSRSASAGTYRTTITATYTDGTTSVVFDSGTATVAANTTGGTLGSAGVAGQGGLTNNTDADATVANIFSSPYGVHTLGSAGNQYSVIDASAGSNLWQMSTPLSLNPAKALKSLTFQVQAAQSGNWNELVIFGLCANPANCPAPPASDPVEALNVTFDPARFAAHPRLLMTPATIPAIKAFYYNSADAVLWRQEFDAYVGACTVPVNITSLTDATEAQRQGFWRLPTVALHYVITGNANSFANAKGFLEFYTALPDWETTIERNSGMGAANNMVGVALAFDWLYNDLDPVFRETVRQKLILQARSLYYGGHLEHNSNIAAIYWQMDPLNNHRWHRDAGFSLAMLAAYSGASSENWIMNRMAAELAFVNSWLPPDGSSHESVSYMVFGGNHLMLATQASDDCLGTHLLDQSFFGKAGLFRLQLSISSFGDMMDFGDYAAPDQGSYNNFILKAASHWHNAELRQGARTLAALQPVAFTFNWFSLLWDDPHLTGGNYQNLPLTAYFDDIGVASFRDSWTAGGVASMFKCSPLGGKSLNQYRNLNNYTYVNVAHDDPDANSFVLFRGNDALAASDQYSQHKSAKQQNTILVNGGGQFPFGRSDNNPSFSQPGTGDMMSMGRIVSRTTLNGASIIEGEARGSYPSVSGTASTARPWIDRYRRLFMWSPNKYVLVLDDLRSPPSQPVNFTWLVQAPTVSTLSGSQGLFRLSGSAQSCEFQLVASQPLTIVTGTSAADNKSASLNYKQLQASGSSSALRIAAAFDPWQKTNLRVALKNATDTGCDVAVTGVGISDMFHWTFAADSLSPSVLTLPAPTVVWNPYPGTTMITNPGQILSLSGSASTLSGTIAQMEFWADGILQSRQSGGNTMSVQWSVPDSANHRLEFRATDGNGMTGSSGSYQTYGTPPSSPAAITNGLTLWLKAETGVVCDATGAVSQWQDGSGSGNSCSQSTASAKPIFTPNQFGMLPGIVFSGSNYLAGSLGVSGTGSYTKIVRVRFRDLGSTIQNNILSAGTGTGTAHMFYLNGTATPKVLNGSVFVTSTASVLADRGYVLAATYDSTTKLGQVYIDGVLAGSGTASSSTALISSYQLGAYQGTNFLKGAIGEVLVYNRALAGSEITSLQNYMSGRMAGPADATATYSQWSATNIGLGKDTSATGCANRYGIANLMAYALGLNLTAATPPILLNTQLADGAISVCYNRPTNRTGIIYELQESSDLQQWTTVADTPGPVSLGIEQRNFTRMVNTDQNVFYRLRVTQSP